MGTCPCGAGISFSSKGLHWLIGWSNLLNLYRTSQDTVYMTKASKPCVQQVIEMQSQENIIIIMIIIQLWQSQGYGTLHTMSCSASCDTLIWHPRLSNWYMFGLLDPPIQCLFLQFPFTQKFRGCSGLSETRKPSNHNLGSQMLSLQLWTVACPRWMICTLLTGIITLNLKVEGGTCKDREDLWTQLHWLPPRYSQISQIVHPCPYQVTGCRKEMQKGRPSSVISSFGIESTVTTMVQAEYRLFLPSVATMQSCSSATAKLLRVNSVSKEIPIKIPLCKKATKTIVSLNSTSAQLHRS